MLLLSLVAAASASEIPKFSNGPDGPEDSVRALREVLIPSYN